MKTHISLPNKITLSRLTLGPLFLILYLTEWPGAKLAGLIIAILIETTDIADGWMARARGETSEVGKLLDPMADSMARISCFIGFLAFGYAKAWMIVILVYRDIGVAYVRTLAALQGAAVGARRSGKWKGVIQGTATITILGLDLLNIPRAHFLKIAFFLMLIVTLYTAFTLWDYIWGNRKILRELHWR